MELTDKVIHLIERYRYPEIFSNPSKSPIKIDRKGKLSEDILRIFSKKHLFRNGSLPEEEYRLGLLSKIEKSVVADKPIPICVLMGPYKNRNLTSDGTADLAEFFAYGFLMQMYNVVKQIYNPSLNISFQFDDARAVKSNYVSQDICQKYVDSCSNLIKRLEFDGVINQLHQFKDLYPLLNVESYIDEAKELQKSWELKQTNSEQLNVHRTNCRRNLIFDASCSEQEIEELVRHASFTYLSLVRAEELAGMYSHDSTIFVSYNLGYKNMLHLSCGRKGDKVFPWQATGAVGYDGHRVLPFSLTQVREKKSFNR